MNIIDTATSQADVGSKQDVPGLARTLSRRVLVRVLKFIETWGVDFGSLAFQGSVFVFRVSLF